MLINLKKILLYIVTIKRDLGTVSTYFSQIDGVVGDIVTLHFSDETIPSWVISCLVQMDKFHDNFVQKVFVYLPVHILYRTFDMNAI